METFHKILKAAVDSGASDVHLKTEKPVIFRVSRGLIETEGFLPSVEWVDQVVEAIVPAHAKTKLENDGEVDFSYYVEGVGRFRTNIFTQRGNYAFAMRHVKSQIPAFEELGLPLTLKKIAEVHRGIVLLAGTTGSGKSTTLAAMLDHLNTNFKKHF